MLASLMNAGDVRSDPHQVYASMRTYLTRVLGKRFAPTGASYFTKDTWPRVELYFHHQRPYAENEQRALRNTLDSYFDPRRVSISCVQRAPSPGQGYVIYLAWSK